MKKALPLMAVVLLLASAAMWTQACNNAGSQERTNTMAKAGNAPANSGNSNATDELPPPEAPPGPGKEAEDPDLPKGEVTDEGLEFPVEYERGKGFIRLSQQNEMLRCDVDVRLPYSGGDGMRTPGSALNLALSVDGLHGRHLFFYPNRLWIPQGGGVMAGYRIEMGWDADQQAPHRLSGEPSFAGKSNVRFWDHWTATMWVDLRYVLVPGNSPASLADEWRIGFMMGNDAAMVVLPSGLDPQNPGKTPDRQIGFKFSELPKVEDDDENPRDQAIAAEQGVYEVMRGVEARFAVKDAPGAFKKVTALLEEDTDQLWAHYLAYKLSFTYAKGGVEGIDHDFLKYLRAYIDAAPGQSSAHLEYLGEMLPLGRFEEAKAHAQVIFESPLCTGRAGTDGYMRLKWSEHMISWGHIEEVKKQFAYIDERPDLVKDAPFRIDYEFQKAELATRQGDSAKAVEIFEALIKNDRKHLTKQQFDLVQQTLQFQRQAVEQWEDELKYQAEDAKKTNPRLVIETSKGKIVIELFEDDAPNTTASMVSLCRKKFYDGLTFHRVEPKFVAQGGDPNGDGTGNPGYRLKREISRRNHFRGTVAMARAQAPDSGGCQFYICTANSINVLNLSGQYAVMGRVIEGMEVADMLRVGDSIISMRAENLRSHEYVPETLPE